MSKHALRRKPRIGHEGGYTLPELTVAATVTLIVAVAVMGFIVVSARQYSGQEHRVTRTDDARNALMRITDELRDAGAVTVVDARTVRAEVRGADGSFHQVTFTCDTATGGTAICTRTDADGEEQLVTGVVNDQNFQLVPGSDITGTGSQGGAIRVRLELDLDDAVNPIVLSSAVKPRNCSSTPGVVNPCI